jgi:ribulose-5-phosphate 4-epimerase/fuculose-1-phosphate aldolase
MTALDRAIRDVVIANRILAHQGVLDAFGHVSVRHPDERGRYLLARSCSPGMVTAADIVEFTLDGRPVGEENRPLYMERFIHGAVYETMPEVKAVLHAHAEDVLPFSITRTPFRPVIQAVGDMGAHIPVWDIADKFGDRTNLLVVNMEQGRDLARCLGGNRVALMRGHGFVSVGVTLYGLVRLSVYIPRNARVLATALRFGEVRGLSEGEVQARMELDPESPAMRRGWEYWAQEAGCGYLLGG